MELTGWSYEQALEFVRLFYWEIRRSQGGVEGLIRSMNKKEIG